MTPKQEEDRAAWEIEAEKALEAGNASHFTEDVIKLIVAKQAMKAETPGAQVSASKTLAQMEAMLVQVTKNASAEKTDEQLAASIAKDLAPVLGVDEDTIKQAYLDKFGRPSKAVH